MLRVEGLTKSYKREPVLRGVSFCVEPASVLGVCGGNGSGKTTLVTILAAILPPDDGKVSLMGVPLGPRADYRRMIGYVPQGIALAPRLTVRQNLMFWASVQGMHGAAMRDAVQEAAVLADTLPFMDKTVARLSGGMARRANLAAGILGNPRLLLLDEPTAGIDEETRDILLAAIRVRRERGSIVVMVNHYANEMEAVCDRIITLKDGVVSERMASRVP